MQAEGRGADGRGAAAMQGGDPVSLQLRRLEELTTACLSAYGGLLDVEVPTAATATGDVMASIQGARYAAGVQRFITAVHGLQRFIDELRLQEALALVSTASPS